MLLTQKISVMTSSSSCSSYFFDLSVIFVEHMIPMIDLAKFISRCLGVRAAIIVVILLTVPFFFAKNYHPVSNFLINLLQNSLLNTLIDPFK